MKIKCKDKAELIKYQIKDEISKLKDQFGTVPVFTIIQVGNNDASNRYVKGKISDCNFVGIKPIHLKLNECISEEELIGEIIKEQKHCDAIIVQLPLPEHINVDNLLKHIDPKKDVDGLTKYSLFDPCTPLGVMCILEEILDLNLGFKDVVVLGRSNLVGLPLANMLQKKNATVTLCHSKTNDATKFMKDADIIISAMGKYELFNEKDYNSNAYVIDVGINYDEVRKKLVGDIPEYFHLKKTPVPGGVGLMTRAMLLKNILKAYKINNNIED